MLSPRARDVAVAIIQSNDLAFLEQEVPAAICEQTEALDELLRHGFVCRAPEDPRIIRPTWKLFEEFDSRARDDLSDAETKLMAAVPSDRDIRVDDALRERVGLDVKGLNILVERLIAAGRLQPSLCIGSYPANHKHIRRR